MIPYCTHLESWRFLRKRCPGWISFLARKWVRYSQVVDFEACRLDWLEPLLSSVALYSFSSHVFSWLLCCRIWYTPKSWYELVQAQASFSALYRQASKILKLSCSHSLWRGMPPMIVQDMPGSPVLKWILWSWSLLFSVWAPLDIAYTMLRLTDILVLEDHRGVCLDLEPRAFLSRPSSFYFCELKPISFGLCWCSLISSSLGHLKISPSSNLQQFGPSSLILESSMFWWSECLWC